MPNSIKKNVLYLQKRFEILFVYMHKKIERYIISPIHPKLEIMRNIVASINELVAIDFSTTIKGGTL